MNQENFCQIKNLPDNVCYEVLEKIWKKFPRVGKLKFNQKAYITHLYHRCALLKKFYETNENLRNDGCQNYTDKIEGELQVGDPQFFTKVFEQMLQEVSFFSSNALNQDWASEKQGFLSVGDDGFSLNLLSLSSLSQEEAQKTTKLKASILDRTTAVNRPSRLRSDLSPTLGIESSQMASIVQREPGYILTPDFALKLLVLNERRKAGISTIFSGGTGVGKVNFIFFFFSFYLFIYLFFSYKSNYSK